MKKLRVISVSCQQQLPVPVVGGQWGRSVFPFATKTPLLSDNPDRIGSRLLRKYNLTLPFPWQLATDTGNCCRQLLYLNG